LLSLRPTSPSGDPLTDDRDRSILFNLDKGILFVKIELVTSRFDNVVHLDAQSSLGFVSNRLCVGSE
jgi:hypothetical protein